MRKEITFIESGSTAGQQQNLQKWKLEYVIAQHFSDSQTETWWYILCLICNPLLIDLSVELVFQYRQG